MLQTAAKKVTGYSQDIIVECMRFYSIDVCIRNMDYKERWSAKVIGV